MKKEYILGIFFFGGLWGINEAVLGGALYKGQVAHASVVLTVIGFVILTLANVNFPQKGTATAIASCAMLYKFLNAPFFACHLLGIFMIGFCYDLFFSVVRTRLGAAPSRSRMKNPPVGVLWRAISAALAVYLSYALFALIITYVFRYEHWVQAGFSKVMRHIGVSGTRGAIGCAVLVPLTFRFGEKFKGVFPTLFRFRWRWVPTVTSLVVAGLWIFATVTYLLDGRLV
jgi:hypothetical protein